MKKMTRRILSMTAAAAIGCSAALSSGFPAALAAETRGTAASDELVSVIVKLSGDGLLTGQEAAVQGTDYLDTAAAASKEASLAQISSAAEAEIRSMYPDLKIDYRYDLLMNGFSCDLPESLIDRVRSCQWVSDVQESKTRVVVKPQLYDATGLGETGYFGETTGYYGEGEVIAVLDTEFDVTHRMFAPIDDKENKLSKQDIAEIAASGALNANVDPDKVYISSKLPYVFDYADDTPYEVTDKAHYHGTHVAGIAAGNPTTNSEGEELAGIASDAQIVMMKVFTDLVVDEASGTVANTVEDNVLIAALEDAAKLKADVINLSLGGPEPSFDDIVSADVISSLNNAGIMVVSAAGNYSNNYIEQGKYYDMDTAVPDTETVVAPSVIKDAFCVASANNSVLRENCLLVDGLDDEIPFSDSGADTMFDVLGDGEFEYVYCGFGRPEDFEGKEVAGKIALIDRGEIFFSDKAQNALDAGAIAMIVCNNADEEHLISMILDDVVFPSVFISLNDGEKLKNAESRKVHIDSTRTLLTPLDGGISEFSSFGPTEKLTIKPEISGIGGSVTSAGYGDKLKVMEGTSMATPYISGCVAIFDQYLRKNGIELSGAEKTRYIRNLMMNSAVLFSNGDVYESPRRQGAGLVNMKNVLNDRVILTGESGLAKVELMDKLTDKLSFNVDITNISDKPVEFKEAKLVLTAEDGGQLEDDMSGQLTICGASNISVDADLSSLLKTEAGESRKVTVNAQLNPDELAYHGSLFPNGFFVEGYLLLSGAENCCDISIPVMGFYGDWADVPIFHYGTKYFPPYSVFSVNGQQTYDSSMSFSGFLEAAYQLLDRLPEEDAMAIFTDPSQLMAYMDEEFMAAMGSLFRDDVVISPDGDGMSDTAGLYFTLLRSAHVSGIKIYNSKNELVSESEGAWLPAHAPSTGGIDDDLSDLPEGEYTAVVEGYVDFDGADKKPQTYTFPIVIDKTAPGLDVKAREEKGRKLIDITATDDNIDAVYVMGKGSGGIAGEYSPEDEPLMELYGAMAGVPSLLVCDGDPDNKVVSDSILMGALMGTEDQFNAGLIASYDHSDIIPAYRYCDEDGNIKVTYDVTDFEDYVVSAMDRGFNVTEKRAEDDAPPTLKTGLWWAKTQNGDVYYNFWDANSGNIRYQSGAPESDFSVSTEGDRITMEIITNGETEQRSGTVAFTDKNSATVTWDDGSAESWTFKSYSGFAAFDFSSTPEIEEMVMEYHNENSSKKAVSAEVTYGEDGLAEVTLLDKSGKKIAVYKNFDRFTNTATSPAGEEVKFSYLKKCIYRVHMNPESDTNHYYVQYDDGKVIVASAEKGILHEYTAEYTDGNMILNKGKEDELILSITRYSNTDAMVTYPDGRQYYVGYAQEIESDDFKVYTTSELEKMAADYCERVRAERPELVSASFLEDGIYLMQFSDGQGVAADPLNAWSNDQGGNYFFLTELPEINDLFTPGLWTCTTEGKMMYYSIDGNGNIKVTDPEDGSESEMQYKWTGVKAVELTDSGVTEKAIAAPVSEQEMALVRPGEVTDMLKFVRTESSEGTEFYSDKELKEMAAKDRSDKTGDSAIAVEAVDSGDGTVTIKFSDGYEYTIDRFTGTGTDADGNEVDLPQTGNNNMSSAAAAAGAGMMVLLGSAAVLCSGRLRRRKENA